MELVNLAFEKLVCKYINSKCLMVHHCSYSSYIRGWNSHKTSHSQKLIQREVEAGFSSYLVKRGSWATRNGAVEFETVENKTCVLEDTMWGRTRVEMYFWRPFDKLLTFSTLLFLFAASASRTMDFFRASCTSVFRVSLFLQIGLRKRCLWKGWRKVAGSAPEITNARNEISCGTSRRMNSVCNFLRRGLRKLILRVGGRVEFSCWKLRSKRKFYLYFCNFPEEICWAGNGDVVFQFGTFCESSWSIVGFDGDSEIILLVFL